MRRVGRKLLNISVQKAIVRCGVSIYIAIFLLAPTVPIFAQVSDNAAIEVGESVNVLDQDIIDEKDAEPVLENKDVSEVEVENETTPEEIDEARIETDTETDVPLLYAGVQTPAAGFEIPTQAKATVDESTGALLYKYEIDLPEGRAGLTPQLSLDYDSREVGNVDTIVADGWNVSIPYIMRIPVLGVNNLYDEPYFSSSLSGNLVAISDTGSTQYVSYRAEADGGEYLKYNYSATESWTVSGKDGLTYTFGVQAADRQDDPTDSSKVYKWMLSMVSDTHGNQIQYSYNKINGQIYPDKISYTYHNLSPAIHTVDFNYVSPTDYSRIAYKSAFEVNTTQLLSEVVVTTSVDGKITTDTYILSHSSAQFNNGQLLDSIERDYEFAQSSFGQTFSDLTKFNYSQKDLGWENGTHTLGSSYVTPDETIYEDTYTADFDNNGYQDVLISDYFNGTNYNYLYLNDGQNFNESWLAWNLPNIDLSSNYAIVDLNGDQLPDLHPRNFNTGQSPDIYLNTGSGFTADASGTWFIKNYVTSASDCGPNVGDAHSYMSNAFLTDINYDGKNDIIFFGGSSNFEVYLNNGSGWTYSSAYSLSSGPNFTTGNLCTAPNGSNDYQTLIDFNGDGKEDYYKYEVGVFLNNGSGFEYSSSYSVLMTVINKGGLGDINNDGLIDVISYINCGENKCLVTYLNNGSGFTVVSSNTVSDSWDAGLLNYHSSYSSRWGKLIDVTADGFPDIVGAKSDSVTGKVRSVNNGQDGWTENTGGQDGWTPFITPNYGTFFDINADNVLDFITPRSTWDGSPMSPTKVYYGKSEVPNRLNEIETPLGAITKVTYGTARTNYSDTGIAPMSVVEKLVIENIGHGQPDQVSSYQYEDGVYVTDEHSGQKRFSGFHKVVATESGTDLQPVRVTETYFHQANGVDGNTSEPVDNDVARIGKIYYSKTSEPGGLPKKEKWHTYNVTVLATENGGRNANFVQVASEVNRVTDIGGSTGTAKSFTYDTNLGEIVEEENLGLVSVSSDGSYTDIGTDDRYKIFSYAINGSNSLVLPAQVDIRTTSSASDTVSRTQYFYDNQSFGNVASLGELTKSSEWVSGDGAVVANTDYTYDSYGNVESVTDPRGAVTTYDYDSSNSYLTAETNEVGHQTGYSYVTGKLKSSNDPNNRTTTYNYSDKGWLYSTETQNTGGVHRTRKMLDVTSGYWRVESYERVIDTTEDQSWQTYDNLGRPVRKIRRRRDHSTGNGDTYYLQEVVSYDELGRKTSISLPTNITATGSINSLITATVPSTLITYTDYDALDRVTDITNAVGTTAYSYAGQDITIIDANNHSKKTTLDAYGNLVVVTEYSDSQQYVTTYSYDVRDLLTHVTDANGNVRSFTYNNIGWVTESEDLHDGADNNFGITSSTYDKNGNLETETKPDGVVVTKTYDELNRLKTINSSSTGVIDFTYTYDLCANGKGYLCSVDGFMPNNVTLNKVYTYGISGKPISITLTTLGNSYATAYEYTYSDEVKKTIYDDGTEVRMAFGDWALPKTVYVKLPGASEAQYASIVRHFTTKPETITIANGPVTTYVYDAAKLYRKSSVGVAQNSVSVQSYDYEYDALGNITQIDDNSVVTNYDYDDLNRLTEAAVVNGVTRSYSYDPIGNVISANTKNYTYSETGKTNPQAVTGINSHTYTYDDNGNMITAPGLDLTYNWQNQPEKIVVTPIPMGPIFGEGTQMQSSAVSGEHETGYEYGNTLKMSYDENAQRFLYTTPSSTEIRAEDNYLVRNAVPEISLAVDDITIGTISNGVSHATITDHLNSPVKQIDNSGVVVEQNTYSPFGDVITHSGSLDTKAGYTGHQEDVDSGLVYAEARYYNPDNLRFAQQDPSHLYLAHHQFNDMIGTERAQLLSDPQQLNSYSYVRNNPINLTDPSGKVLETIADVAFTGYSIYKLGEALFTGGDIKGETLNLGLDLAGTAVPFVPALGTAKRALKASEVSKIAEYTSKNFRNNLLNKKGVNKIDALDLDAHHRLPQKFEIEFNKMDINIHNPIHGDLIQKNLHRQNSYSYNKEIRKFLGTSPGKKEMINFSKKLTELMKKNKMPNKKSIKK